MKFGYRNLSRPTPESIDKWFDFTAAVCSFVAVAVNDSKVTFISIETASIISWVTGLTSGILLIGKRFFGVKPTGQKSIPLEDVTVMEDKK